MRIKVITFGTFDLVHPWHEYYLSQAKKLGDELITIVSRDQTVEKFKWHKTLNNEIKRLQDIKKLWISNIVELWDKKDYFKSLEKHKPDIIALGYDQTYLLKELSKFLYENKFRSNIVTIKPLNPEKFKSSKLKKS